MIAGSTGAVITAIVLTLELAPSYGAALPIILCATLALATRSIFLPRITIYTLHLYNKRNKTIF